jgi:antitoxin HicB
MVMPEADGSFRAEILEFPGCIAVGGTPGAALDAVETAAASWLEGALERGQPIPEPVDNNEFSGRMVVRMPRSLHKKATRVAGRDRVSLNQLVVASIAEYVGERARPSGGGTLNFVTNSSTHIAVNTIMPIVGVAAGPTVLGGGALAGAVFLPNGGIQPVTSSLGAPWPKRPSTR